MKMLLNNKNAWKFLTICAMLFFIATIIIEGKIASRASAVDISETITNSPCGWYSKYAGLPEEKRNGIDDSYKICIAALTSTPTSNPNFVPQALPLTSIINNKINYPQRIAGSGIIIWNFPLNVSPLEFWQTNAWFEKIQGKYIYVFAGSSRDGGTTSDLSQGALWVMVTNQFPINSPGGGVYNTPTKNGPITIVDANGEVLTLVSYDGSIINFDVSSRKFVIPNIQSSNIGYSRQINDSVLIEKGTSPFAGQGYTFFNQWYREVNGNRITIYAGLDNINFTGVILTVTSTGAPQSGDMTNVYKVANKFRYFRIFDVNENLITIVNDELRQFVFDLSARRFLSDSEIDNLPLDPVIATYEAPAINLLVTPSPTITKIPTPNRTLTAAPPTSYP